MRIGISKTYAGGTLTNVTALFGLLKTMIVDAGFNVLANLSDRIEFMPAGATPAADTNDDTPHWTIYLNGTTEIKAAALHGLAWNDAGIRTGTPAIAVTANPQYWDPIDEVFYNSQLQIWAAASGREGWFWIGTRQWATDDSQETFDVYHAVTIGAKSRRMPSDMTSDNWARYGLLTAAGLYLPAFGRNNAGSVVAPTLGWWSPLCADGAGIKRHPASTLAQLAAPVYPKLGTSTLSAAVMGDIEDAMIATNGYTHLGTTIPGWVTFNSAIHTDAPLVLKAPASFTPV
jgi:hypothetical protein